MSGNYNNRIKQGYNNRRRGNQSGNEINKVVNEIKKLDKLADMSVKDFADEGGYADIVAKNSKELKTTQLRKFFGAVRLMEQKDNLTWKAVEPEFYILKPRLAVSVGRNNMTKDFYNLMMEAMRLVDKGTEEEKLKGFKNFVDFFESIVAYHKYYHGNK